MSYAYRRTDPCEKNLLDRKANFSSHPKDTGDIPLQSFDAGSTMEKKTDYRRHNGYTIYQSMHIHTHSTIQCSYIIL